jgi:hypothetical protein
MMKLNDYIKERDRAFENDDLEWTQRQLAHLNPLHPNVILMAFHKARYECPSVSRDQRLASQKWLHDNHVRKYDGSYVILGEALPP